MQTVQKRFLALTPNFSLGLLELSPLSPLRFRNMILANGIIYGWRLVLPLSKGLSMQFLFLAYHNGHRIHVVKGGNTYYETCNGGI